MNIPRVGIIMGSDSDLSVMQDAAEILAEFSIEHEVNIVSAHRTPLRMIDYAKEASGRGLAVIIAGAGGAAHLPGMVASVTPLPVIGVPVKASISIAGWDSVLSILQMPPGVPVACVGIGKPGAKNPALLAVQIMATANPDLQKKFIEYKAKMADQVRQKNKKLQEKLK